jgi:acetyl esterase/lipase
MPRNARRLALTLSVTTLALCGAALSFAPAGALRSLWDGAMILRGGGQFPPDETLIYKETSTRPLDVHIFRARAGPPLGATVILFHGGGFHSGWPEEFFPLATALTAAGHTIFVPAYRLQRADGATWDQEFEDALDAIAWTRKHAEAFGGNPNTLVIGGSSAGAHLAAAAVTVPPPTGRERPPAVGLLLIAAYVDSAEASARAQRRATETSRLRKLLLGEPQDVFEGRSEASSPLAHLHAGVPPALLLLGAEDRLWPAAREFCETLTELGGRCRAKAYPGAGHAFGIYGYDDHEEMVRDSLTAIDAWMLADSAPPRP